MPEARGLDGRGLIMQTGKLPVQVIIHKRLQTHHSSAWQPASCRTSRPTLLPMAVHRELPIGANGSPQHQGLASHHAGVAGQVASGSVVAAVHHHVIC